VNALIPDFVMTFDGPASAPRLPRADTVGSCMDILHGATLSHQRAVGYEHLSWLERAILTAGLTAIEAVKSGLDPRAVTKPGKRGFGFAEWGLRNKSE
jgi:hypothetical protein